MNDRELVRQFSERRGGTRDPTAPQRLPHRGGSRIGRAALGTGILPGGVVDPAVVAKITQRMGRGARLDTTMGAWSHATLGVDPERVSVHHDAHADALTRAVAARAFTVQNDVFFGHGEYQPATRAGRQLLAHELTHVAQQQSAVWDQQLRVSDPGDASEQEATRLSADAP